MDGMKPELSMISLETLDEPTLESKPGLGVLQKIFETSRQFEGSVFRMLDPQDGHGIRLYRTEVFRFTTRREREKKKRIVETWRNNVIDCV